MSACDGAHTSGVVRSLNRTYERTGAVVNETPKSSAAVTYATSAELPAGKGVVVIQTPHGPVMVVREGKITPALVAEIVEMHDALAASGLLEPEQEP